MDKFPIRFMIKEWLPVTSKEPFYWKTVCTVENEEQLSYMKRLFKVCDIEYETSNNGMD